MSEDVLIVGLGAMGASIGLALQQAGANASLVGFDSDSQIAHEARQAGCVQRLVHRPDQAASHARLILLTEAAPVSLERLTTLAPRMPAGAVVLDASPLKQPGLAWAARSLPADRHYVAILPIIGGANLLLEGEARDRPSADRYRGGMMALCAPAGAAEQAVDAALAFAGALGAAPFFVDAAEADGVLALAETLPILLGSSLMRVGLHRSGWHEVERLAGVPFARLALHGAETTAPDVSGTVALNRPNVLAKLDALLLELGELRDTIARMDDKTLEERVRSTNASLAAWLTARQRPDWASGDAGLALPPRQGVIDRLFGIHPAVKRRPGG
jgi:prephenate dehydrogenase